MNSSPCQVSIACPAKRQVPTVPLSLIAKANLQRTSWNAHLRCTSFPQHKSRVYLQIRHEDHICLVFAHGLLSEFVKCSLTFLSFKPINEPDSNKAKWLSRYWYVQSFPNCFQKNRTAFMDAKIWIQQCLISSKSVFLQAGEDKMFQKFAQFDLGCPGRIGELLNWYWLTDRMDGWMVGGDDLVQTP